MTLTDDHHDPDLRHRNNLIAAIVILVLAVATLWTIREMIDYEKQQRCLASGRRNCLEIPVPPR